MSNEKKENAISANDERLIEEALRRLEAHPAGTAFNRDAVFAVLVEQVRRGRRSVFSLVRAGQEAIDGR